MSLASVAGVAAAAAAVTVAAPVAILGGLVTIGGASTGMTATIAGLSAVGAGSITSEIASASIKNDDLAANIAAMKAKKATEKDEPINTEIIDDVQESEATKA